MTNIHDIAKASGYSVGTVSRVLNHKKYVSEPARQAILKTIKAYNYVPNRIARSLSDGQTATFGIVVPDIAQSFYNEFVRGAAEVAFKHHYRVELLPSSYAVATERRYLELLRQQTFDGLIFVSHELPLAEIETYLPYGRIIICHDPGTSRLPAVYATRLASYAQAFRWAKSRQQTRIGLIFGRSAAVSATSQATITAYTSVFGQAPDPKYIKIGGTSYHDGYRLAAYFQSQPVDLILASSDDVAAGVSRYFADQNLPCPQLIGQDRQVSGELLNLATVDHHITQLGQTAADLLIAGDNRTVKIESQFIQQQR